MAERFKDSRFDARGQSRLATLKRLERRSQAKLARHPVKGLEDFLRADVIAVQWALDILLADHARPLGEIITQETKRRLPPSG